MKTICEVSLDRFEFWAGAVDSSRRFTLDELDTLEAILEDCYPEGIDETTLNDIFWFEPETLCEWLDIDFDEWIEREDDYRYKN